MIRPATGRSTTKAMTALAIVFVIYLADAAPAQAQYYWYGDQESGLWDAYDPDTPFIPDDWGYLNWKSDNNLDGFIERSWFLPEYYDYITIVDVHPDHPTIDLNAASRHIFKLTIDTTDYFDMSGGLLSIETGEIIKQDAVGSANHLISADVYLELSPQVTLNDADSFLHISGILTASSGLDKYGPGELVLSNPQNDIRGAIEIHRGTLRIAPIQPDQYVIGELVRLHEGTLEIDNDVTSIDDVEFIAGRVDVEPGRTFTVQGDLLAYGETGEVVGGGTVRTNDVVWYPTGAGALKMNGATLELGGRADAVVSLDNGGVIRPVSSSASMRSVLAYGEGVIDTNGLNFNVGSIRSFSTLGAITKTGAGRLQTYFSDLADLTIDQGTVAAGNPAGLDTLRFAGDTASGVRTLRLNSGGNGETNLVLSRHGVIDTNGYDWSTSGILAGGGDLTKTGAGTLTLTGGDYLIGYSGEIRVHGGVLALDRPTQAGGGDVFIESGAELHLIGAKQLADETAVDVNGGTLRIDGASHRLGSLSLRGGTVAGAATFETSDRGSIIANGSTESTIGADLRLVDAAGGDGVVEVWVDDAPLRIAGDLAAPNVRINKTGLGTLRIEGTTNSVQAATLSNGVLELASYLEVTGGPLVFDRGILRLGAGVVLPGVNFIDTPGFDVNVLDLNGHTAAVFGILSGPERLSLVGPGLLNLDAPFISPFSHDHGGFTVSSGAVLRASLNDRLGRGSLELNGGVLEIGFDATLPSQREITLSLDGGTFRVADGHTLTVDAQIEGPFIGSRLTLDGAGVVTLTADNPFRGGTLITGGSTLLASNTTGSATGVGDVVVANGTLGGAGAVAGSVRMESDGVLAPGNSIGTLAVGSLELASGAEMQFELDPTADAADLIEVLGVVDLNADSGAGAMLSLLLQSAPTPGQRFTLIANNGPGEIHGQFAQGDLAFGSLADGLGYAFTVNYAGGDGNDLVITAIPEPSVLVLLACAAGVAPLWRRR